MAREVGEKEKAFKGSCQLSQVWTEACPVDRVTQFKLFFEKNDKNVFSLWKRYGRNMLSIVGKLKKKEELLHFETADSVARKDLYFSL